jgi:hypothetical protein
VSDDEITSLSRRLTLNSDHLKWVAEHVAGSGTLMSFQEILVRLHAAVSQHWVDKKTGKPAKIDGGIVQKIHISIFGFSRGATQARAFTNWLMALCKLDAHLSGRGDVMKLGGFQVAFDFWGFSIR